MPHNVSSLALLESNGSDVTPSPWARAELASALQVRQLWPVLLYLAVLLATGLGGNGLVLYVHAARFRPSSTRSYVIALAVLDLLSCLLAMPSEILDLCMAFTFTQPALCKVMRAISTFVLVASGMTLTAVAADRYRRICRAMGPQLTSRSAAMMVVGACVVSVFLSWPAAVIYGLRRVDDGHGTVGVECSTDAMWDGTKWPLIYTLILAVVFVTALVSMTVIYILIGRQVFQQDRFRAKVRQRSITTSGESEGEHQLHSRGDMESESPAYDPPSSDVARKNSDVARKNSDVARKNSDASRKNHDVTRSLSDANAGRKRSIFKRKRSGSGSYAARTRRTTFMLFLITLIFVLSFLPHLALKTLRAVEKGWVGRGGDGRLLAYNLLVRSYFLNSVSNAFVYGFCSPAFRKQTSLMLHRLLGRGRRA